jgi:hypothetical protein
MLYVYGSGSVSQFKTIHAILLHVTRGRTDKTGQSNNGSAKQEEGGNERGEEADLYLIDCLINFSNACQAGLLPACDRQGSRSCVQPRIEMFNRDLSPIRTTLPCLNSG